MLVEYFVHVPQSVVADESEFVGVAAECDRSHAVISIAKQTYEN